MQLRSLTTVCVGLLLTACGDAQGSATTQDPKQSPASRPSKDMKTPSNFMRFRKTGEDQGMLETGVVTYADGKGHEITLIGAVHIADEKHFAELQKEFESYDSLLYELVASAKDRPHPGGSPRGGLSFIQRGMAAGFELKFQLDSIDYRPKNFVHADLTPSEFRRLQSERQESILTLMFRAMQGQMKMMQKNADEGEDEGETKGKEVPDLVAAFRAGYGRHTLRMGFAGQIEDIEKMAAGFGGEDGESVLVEGRNRKAMEVAATEIAKGKKTLAIYYGAAHLPDFEERILALGYKKSKHRWLTAWDCTKRKDPKYRKKKK